MNFTHGRSCRSGYFHCRNIGARVQRFPDAANFCAALPSEKFGAVSTSGLFRVPSRKKRGANMLRWTLIFLVIVMSVGALTLTGCSTDEPGATNTLGFYSTNVNAAPDSATTAAYKACEDLKFTDINSNASKVDGKVTAKTAQGDDVVIDISQAGDKVSKVTVHVGATGDTSISHQLVDRINSHFSWF
jgi:uncharacterized membrane protein YtjA (UPF0391 family)